MFETIFNNLTSNDVTSIQIGSSLISVVVALILGLVISMVYIVIAPKKECSQNFILSLVILPALVTIVIMLIGSNIARAFSIAGVFALIRFRSVPGDSKDITFVFLSMAVGLTTGLGFLTFAAAITVIICLVIVIVKKVGYGTPKRKEMKLRITIPEDMNYQGVFDDIFSKYTMICEMQKVRTSNLGTLYELYYDTILKDKVSDKEFIDALRCRNGNLTIQLEVKEYNYQQL